MRFLISIRTVGLFVLLLAINKVCLAEVKLPSLFSDNMVLQRERANPMWGWSQAGETIIVTIAEQSVMTRADKEGHWQVALPKLPAHRKPLELQVKGSSGSKVVLKNILVGDVWFCTGPSNIFWPVHRCDHAKREIATAKYPNIRFFTVKKGTADVPQKDCQGDWTACSPQTVGDVSGIGYFFSRRVHREINVPIGLLQSFWGGSRVESWTSREALKAQPSLKPILQEWDDTFRKFDSGKSRTEYQKQLKQWQLLAAKARDQGKKPPAKPKAPANPHLSQHRPASLYNAMVAPLIPFGIRGVISYQGLGNLYWAEHSRVLMATMIRDWRARWNQGPFPFGMVQPAPYPCGKWAMRHRDAYSMQRESQLQVLDEVPHTGIALTMDIGDLNELHFTNKQDVARRLAAWALTTVYQRNVPYAGPVYQSMTVQGNKVRIRFKHTGKGLSTADNQPPTHFTIAGADKKFHPATATIDGHTVIVHCKQVSRPVAVRFAWSDTAIPNLINSDGLPASLFRTDVVEP